MMKNLTKTIGTIASALITVTAMAQGPGLPIENFGENGIVHQDNIGISGEIYNQVITLSDDRILMVGFSDNENQDVILAKFNPDGTPDTNFGDEGFASIDASIGGDEQGWAVTELENGKLLVSGIMFHPGEWNGFVMRLHANGEMDASFGDSNGYTEFNAGDNAITVGVDIASPSSNDIFVAGSVLVDGQLDMAVFKFTQGGALHNAFASEGVAFWDGSGETDEVTSIAISQNGQIYLSGTSENVEGQRRGVIVKMTAFGTPTQFAGNGAFFFDEDIESNAITDVKISNDDKVVAVGNSGTHPNIDGYIFRLDNNGNLDPTFSDDGYTTTNPGAATAMHLTDVLLPSSGGVIAVGHTSGNLTSAYAFAMAEDGSPVIEFAEVGDTYVEMGGDTNEMNIRGAALQSDGDIIMGGDFTTQEIPSNRLFLIGLEGFGTNGLFDAAPQYLEAMVFPNPTTSSFKIDIDAREELAKIDLINLNGEIMHNWTEKQPTYDLPANIANGHYILKVKTKSYVYMSRIVVIK